MNREKQYAPVLSKTTVVKHYSSNYNVNVIPRALFNCKPSALWKSVSSPVVVKSSSATYVVVPLALRDLMYLLLYELDS
jgi:hypothetical protein